MQEQRLIMAIILQAFADLNINITERRRICGDSLYERTLYRNWAINFFNDSAFKWLMEKIDKEHNKCFESIKPVLEKSYKEYVDISNKTKIEKEIKDLPLFTELLRKRN